MRGLAGSIVESIQEIFRFKFEGVRIMHPVSYLFEDIYRNYWGISPASRPGEGRLARMWRRNRELPPPRNERRRDV
jgi:hypothetical protein